MTSIVFFFLPKRDHNKTLATPRLILHTIVTGEVGE